MITLVRFNSNNQEFVLNCDLIETVEETPDTVITLITGKKILVEERMDEIVRKVIDYRRVLSSTRGIR